MLGIVRAKEGPRSIRFVSYGKRRNPPRQSPLGKSLFFRHGCAENQHSHACKKEIFQAVIALADYAGCHSPPKRSGLSGDPLLPGQCRALYNPSAIPLSSCKESV